MSVTDSCGFIKQISLTFLLPSILEFNSFGCKSTDFGETYSKLHMVGDRGLRHCTDDDWAENPSPTA